MFLLSCSATPQNTPSEKVVVSEYAWETPNNEKENRALPSDTLCSDMTQAYFGEIFFSSPYEIVSEIYNESSWECLMGYYYGNESGIFTYTLYNLSQKKLLGEISCEPDYDVENDILRECSSESLQNLKMEYEYLLSSYL